MSKARLTMDLMILMVLDEKGNGGFETGAVTNSLIETFPNDFFKHYPYEGAKKSQYSAEVRRNLLMLKGYGYVEELDDRKPVCWCRTPEGTKNLKDRSALLARNG